MELKKSESANTEKLRGPVMLIGLLFVGSIVLASFSYTTSSIREKSKDTGKKVADIDIQLDEQSDDTPPPPPPPSVDAPPPVVEDIIEEDNTEEEPVAEVPIPPPADLGEVDEPVLEAEIIDFPDVEAGFPGGAAAMQRWISENVVYPETAIELEEQGRVYLSFVVEPNGSITNVVVERGVSRDLDREAKRVVRRMPPWSPGEASGKSVRTRCRLPIIFELN